jgi:multiple sugar transport system permease protein
MSSVETVGPATRRRGLRRSQRQTITFFLFITPWLLGFICLSIIPLVVGFLSSLTNYDGLSLANMRFVGAANYVRAFNDPDVAYSLGRTLIWGAVNVPLYLVISFSLALMLNQGIRGQGFFRTLFYLPSIVPLAAALIAWKVILDKNVGLLNAALDLVFPGTAIGWLSDYALQGMAMISIWAGLGVGMVIFLAALQGIPDEYEEAARIDGANSWRVLRHVTLPLMTPVIFLMLVMGLINSFQQLGLPLLLTEVGLTSQGAVPPRPIYLYMIHTYWQIFTNRVYGYGNALLWMLFVAVLALTAVVFWTQRYWVYTEQSREDEQK